MKEAPNKPKHRNLEKPRRDELGYFIPKDEFKYIQSQIEKIRNLAENRQSQIARQILNEVRRTSTSSAKLKATC